MLFWAFGSNGALHLLDFFKIVAAIHHNRNRLVEKYIVSIDEGDVHYLEVCYCSTRPLWPWRNRSTPRVTSAFQLRLPRISPCFITRLSSEEIRTIPSRWCCLRCAPRFTWIAFCSSVSKCGTFLAQLTLPLILRQDLVHIIVGDSYYF